MRLLRVYQELAVVPELADVGGAVGDLHGGAEGGDERVSQDDEAVPEGIRVRVAGAL